MLQKKEETYSRLLDLFQWPVPLSSKRRKNVKNIDEATSLARSKAGGFIKSIDKGIPGNHTRLLYNGKSKTHARILCQLRTGIRRLNSYLSRIQAAESAEFRCSTGKETVHHFLFCCPLWDQARPHMKQLADRHNRWGDTSFLLGGWSGSRKDGDIEKWKPDLAMVAATINFAVKTRRLDNEISPVNEVQAGDGVDREAESEEEGSG